MSTIISSLSPPDTIGDSGCGDPGAVLLPDIVHQEQEEEGADTENKHFDHPEDNPVSRFRKRHFRFHFNWFQDFRILSKFLMTFETFWVDQSNFQQFFRALQDFYVFVNYLGGMVEF